MEERIFRVYVNTLFPGNKGTNNHSTNYTKPPFSQVTKVVTIIGHFVEFAVKWYRMEPFQIILTIFNLNFWQTSI